MRLEGRPLSRNIEDRRLPWANPDLRNRPAKALRLDLRFVTGTPESAFLAAHLASQRLNWTLTRLPGGYPPGALLFAPSGLRVKVTTWSYDENTPKDRRDDGVGVSLDCNPNLVPTAVSLFANANVEAARMLHLLHDELARVLGFPDVID